MADAFAELRNACFEVARTTKWVQKPIDSAEIGALAERLATIAASFASEPLEIDIPLITRAVRYLGQVHAIPPMDEDTQWFSNMLQVVLEIARPNSGMDEAGKAFLKDMQDGIETSLAA